MMTVEVFEAKYENRKR